MDESRILPKLFFFARLFYFGAKKAENKRLRCLKIWF